MKKCHNCGEMIEDSTQVCKFCGKDVPLENIQSVGLYMPTNAPRQGGPSKESHINLVGGMEFFKKAGWKGVFALLIILVLVYLIARYFF